MNKLLDDYFSNLKNLWNEYRLFKKFRMLPKWCAIVLFILLLPFLVGAGLGVGFFAVVYFLYYIGTVPTSALHKIIRNESKEIHFGAQIAIYLVCFPVVFFFYVLLALLLPVFFIVYFAMSVDLYVASIGGIKFVAFLSTEVDRDFELPTKVFSKARSFSYTIVACALFFVTALFGVLALYGVFFIFDVFDVGLLFSICLLTYNIWLIIGHLYLKKSKAIEHEEQPKEVVSEGSKDKANEDKKEVVEKEHTKLTWKNWLVFGVTLLGIVASLIFAIGFAPDREFLFTYINRYTLNNVFFVLLGILSAVTAIGFVVMYFIKKVRKFCFIPLAVSCALMLVLVALTVLGIVLYIVNSPTSWYFDNSIVLYVGFLVVSLACYCFALVFYLVNNKKQKLN